MNLASAVALISSFGGLLVLAFRLLPALRRGGPRPSFGKSLGKVSLIVPARNEERNLPRLLRSLSNLKYPDLELIFVDDQSTDATAALVQEFAQNFTREGFQVLVVSGRERPVDWMGKNWACHQGFEAANGNWILFTDADTAHEPESISIALQKMEDEKLDLLTAIPYHLCERGWEKLLGPFQMFLLVSTAAFSKPQPDRVFAIGQYLLFRRESYVRQGGHERIRDVLCDDLELAKHCLAEGGQMIVEGRQRLFRVQMYESFGGFVRGWRRIIRLGFRHARRASAIEMYFVVAVLTLSFHFDFADREVMGALVGMLIFSLAILARVQKRFGEFSVLGVLLYPLSLFLFILVSGLAVFDLALKRQYIWRGRAYSKTAD